MKDYAALLKVLSEVVRSVVISRTGQVDAIHNSKCVDDAVLGECFHISDTLKLGFPHKK